MVYKHPPAKPKHWLTSVEVLGYVRQNFNRHWSKAYLYALLKQNKLKGFKIGNTRFFTKLEIARTIKKMTKPSPSMPMKKGTKPF